MNTKTTQTRVSGALDPIVRKFRLHWRSGKPEDITTRNPGSRTEAAAAAMNEAGIGAGALAALDYWEELPNAKAGRTDEGGLAEGIVGTNSPEGRE